jgi:hypothetical protein
MSVMGQMLKPKKTEVTEKLRQEINKVCEGCEMSVGHVLDCVRETRVKLCETCVSSGMEEPSFSQDGRECLEWRLVVGSWACLWL